MSGADAIESMLTVPSYNIIVWNPSDPGDGSISIDFQLSAPATSYTVNTALANLGWPTGSSC